jgi:type II secretory pathway pseudopilin PulG
LGEENRLHRHEKNDCMENAGDVFRIHKVNSSALLPPAKNPPPALPMRKSKNQAFSLVEVVLALGVVAFAFVAILGLIPAGMNSFRQAINISEATSIGQRVISDAFQADYDTLMTAPVGTSDSTTAFMALYRYFDEEGNEILSTPPQDPTKMSKNAPPSNLTGVIPFTYLVITRIVPNITLPGAPSVSPTASLTVQVVFDPSQYLPQGASDFPVPSSSDANQSVVPLLNSPKIPPGNVMTYYAYITRN